MTVFLLFDPLAVTPPNVTYGQAYTVKRRGESGRYWEHLTFGGYIDLQGDFFNPLEVVVAVRHTTKYVWPMNWRAVDELVEHRSKSCI